MGTSDENRDEYVAQMGRDLGECFHALRNDLTILHWRWRQFEVLFGGKAERIDLLNAAAPVFFRIVQDVLFEDTLLGIARLVGPAVSMGHPQLSLARLLLHLPGPPRPSADIGLWAEVRVLILRAELSAAFAVDWRHNRIAHRNLGLALGKPMKPLSKASRQKVDTALETLSAVLNRVQTSFSNSVTSYRNSALTGDAESLLYVLRDGKRLERERSARWNRGESDEDDSPGPPI